MNLHIGDIPTPKTTITMENTKEKALNGTLYGVHKEAIKKHHAFEKCIHQAMDIYANDQTTQHGSLLLF